MTSMHILHLQRLFLLRALPRTKQNKKAQILRKENKMTLTTVKQNKKRFSGLMGVLTP